MSDVAVTDKKLLFLVERLELSRTFLLDGDGMLEVIEAMQSRDFEAQVRAWSLAGGDETFSCAFQPPSEPDGDAQWVDGYSLPEVVVCAAYTTLMRYTR